MYFLLQKSISKDSEREEAWKRVDQLLHYKHNDSIQLLADRGISEGDMDDESSEGQIWQMIEGRLPYTLDMV